MCAIIPVTCETVEFPDNNGIKHTLSAIFYHTLKFRAVIGFSRQSTVDIAANNGNIVFLTISSTLTQLTFYTFLALVVARISSIDHRVHSD